MKLKMNWEYVTWRWCSNQWSKFNQHTHTTTTNEINYSYTYTYTSRHITEPWFWLTFISRNCLRRKICHPHIASRPTTGERSRSVEKAQSHQRINRHHHEHHTLIRDSVAVPVFIGVKAQAKQKLECVVVWLHGEKYYICVKSYVVVWLGYQIT